MKKSKAAPSPGTMTCSNAFHHVCMPHNYVLDMSIFKKLQFVTLCYLFLFYVPFSVTVWKPPFEIETAHAYSQSLKCHTLKNEQIIFIETQKLKSKEKGICNFLSLYSQNPRWHKRHACIMDRIHISSGLDPDRGDGICINRKFSLWFYETLIFRIYGVEVEVVGGCFCKLLCIMQFLLHCARGTYILKYQIFRIFLYVLNYTVWL
jgi:hypothetical protein